jgi:outer membrane protein assembly factor BamB
MWVHRYMVIGILATCVALLNISAIADDWPNWRGPNHNGISHEVNWIGNMSKDVNEIGAVPEEVNWVGEWTDCEPNIVWEQQVGTGFSSIAVANGRLYTMGNTGTKDDGLEAEHQDVVYCLDPNTGEVLWTHMYASALNADGYYEGGPTATPTVVDGQVYTFSKHGVAFCLDANDGAVLWERDLVQDFGVAAPMWDFAGSPYVDANLVIYNAGTHGLALNVPDGSLAWETGIQRSGYSTPVPFDLGPRRLVALMGRRTVAAVEVQTGALAWEYTWVTHAEENIPDPIVDGNSLFVSTGQGKGSTLFDMYEDGVVELWSHKDMQSFLNSPVLWDGYLYGANEQNKKLTCMEFATGQIMWSEIYLGRGSVMMADGKLIMLSDDGLLTIAQVAHDHYQELGCAQILTGRCWTVPILANGKIYARNAIGDLVCVKLEPVQPALGDAG